MAAELASLLEANAPLDGLAGQAGFLGALVEVLESHTGTPPSTEPLALRAAMALSLWSPVVLPTLPEAERAATRDALLQALLQGSRASLPHIIAALRLAASDDLPTGLAEGLLRILNTAQSPAALHGPLAALRDLCDRFCAVDASGSRSSHGDDVADAVAEPVLVATLHLAGACGLEGRGGPTGDDGAGGLEALGEGLALLRGLLFGPLPSSLAAVDARPTPRPWLQQANLQQAPRRVWALVDVAAGAVRMTRTGPAQCVVEAALGTLLALCRNHITALSPPTVESAVVAAASTLCEPRGAVSSVAEVQDAMHLLACVARSSHGVAADAQAVLRRDAQAILHRGVLPHLRPNDGALRLWCSSTDTFSRAWMPCTSAALAVPAAGDDVDAMLGPQLAALRLANAVGLLSLPRDVREGRKQGAPGNAGEEEGAAMADNWALEGRRKRARLKRRARRLNPGLAEVLLPLLASAAPDSTAGAIAVVLAGGAMAPVPRLVEGDGGMAAVAALLKEVGPAAAVGEGEDRVATAALAAMLQAAQHWALGRWAPVLSPAVARVGITCAAPAMATADVVVGARAEALTMAPLRLAAAVACRALLRRLSRDRGRVDGLAADGEAAVGVMHMAASLARVDGWHRAAGPIRTAMAVPSVAVASRLGALARELVVPAQDALVDGDEASVRLALLGRVLRAAAEADTTGPEPEPVPGQGGLDPLLLLSTVERAFASGTGAVGGASSDGHEVLGALFRGLVRSADVYPWTEDMVARMFTAVRRVAREVVATCSREPPARRGPVFHCAHMCASALAVLDEILDLALEHAELMPFVPIDDMVACWAAVLQPLWDAALQSSGPDGVRHCHHIACVAERSVQRLLLRGPAGRGQAPCPEAEAVACALERALAASSASVDWAASPGTCRVLVVCLALSPARVLAILTTGPGAGALSPGRPPLDRWLEGLPRAVRCPRASGLARAGSVAAAEATRHFRILTVGTIHLALGPLLAGARAAAPGSDAPLRSALQSALSISLGERTSFSDATQLLMSPEMAHRSAAHMTHFRSDGSEANPGPDGSRGNSPGPSSWSSDWESDSTTSSTASAQVTTSTVDEEDQVALAALEGLARRYYYASEGFLTWFQVWFRSNGAEAQRLVKRSLLDAVGSYADRGGAAGTTDSGHEMAMMLSEIQWQRRSGSSTGAQEA